MTFSKPHRNVKAKQLADAEAAKLASAGEQSDEFIVELMSELSAYDDAVASVDRENEYQRIWKNLLATINTISPEEGKKTFQTMESLLKKCIRRIYKQTLIYLFQ